MKVYVVTGWGPMSGHFPDLMGVYSCRAKAEALAKRRRFFVEERDLDESESEVDRRESEVSNEKPS